MKWHLKDIKQETNHPFLNYYTLTYEVEKEDGSHIYEYYMCSRKDIASLRAKTHEYAKPDAVFIPMYHIDEKGTLRLLLTKQFRPPIGDYVISFSAGLIDQGEDVLEAAKREAKEEVGAEIDDLELWGGPAPTSSGLSDECNSIVLARIVSFGDRELEEYEDIDSMFIPIDEAVKMVYDPDSRMSFIAKLTVLYLNERFKR
ncbi:MAG: NUDIX hydrolase [Bacilli bacterium]|nr:NUDIX hydrolase [Bacilli bacterium]